MEFSDLMISEISYLPSRNLTFSAKHLNSLGFFEPQRPDIGEETTFFTKKQLHPKKAFKTFCFKTATMTGKDDKNFKIEQGDESMESAHSVEANSQRKLFFAGKNNVKKTIGDRHRQCCFSS